MNPYVIGAIALGLIVTHASAFIKGRSYAETQQQAAYSKQLEQVITEHNANAAKDAQAAFEAGKKQAGARVVTRTIREQVDKVVDRPVYRDCRLDDDGFRLWNDANRGSLAEANTAGKPDPAPAKLPRIN